MIAGWLDGLSIGPPTSQLFIFPAACAVPRRILLTIRISCIFLDGQPSPKEQLIKLIKRVI